MADNYDDYSKEQLLRLLRERDRRPQFGLVWERDEIAHDLSVNSDFVAMDQDLGLSCGQGAQTNLIIEADNFDALRYLRMTHAGRIKCIYIDPPYNTGNRDFIYNDRFVDKDDAYRHSKWLEFMFRRLELAKELLTKDGVIFVSIDDNEVFHLGLLMEQIFGPENFVANIIWQKRTSPDSRIELGPAHDYIIVFSLHKSQTSFNKLGLNNKQADSYKNPDKDPRGLWSSADFTAQGYRPNQMYEITTPGGKVLTPPPGRCWANLQSVFETLVADKKIWFGKDGNARPRVKNFLAEAKGVSSWTWWSNDEVGHNQEAKREILEILGGGVSEIFSTPKPVRLIDRIVRVATNPGDIVLDFFAGSGTTAQAVLNLNREDGGNRQFILVSNTEATADAPDKNLCRDVCAERVRRVIEGYTNKKGEAVAGLGNGFAYLRARRISAASVFRRIQHEQVWTALQLIHGVPLSLFDKAASLHVATAKRGLVLYVTQVNDAVIDALSLSVHSADQAIVYAWQPALLAQRLVDPRLSFEAIPAFLVERFGARAKVTTGGRA